MDFIEVTNQDGTRGSAKLPANIKNYLIDIDGTICDDIPNEEPWRMPEAKEISGAKEHLNNWYEAGHIITFFTSRLEAHRGITETWLKDHGFKYHALLMEKPRGGNYHWIDDRDVECTKFTSWDIL
jgi:uncharacterized HAD superfamily protein